MQRYDFALEICLKAPFLQSGLAQSSIAYDSAPLVDQTGKIIISGDQIEGYIQAVMKEAGAGGLASKWFGSRGKQLSEGDAPDPAHRSRANIGDLKASKPTTSADAFAYHRIAVEEGSGSAQAGSWQVIQQHHRPGEEVRFTGTGWFVGEDGEEASDFIRWANATLKIVPALGALKSPGFGKILEGSINEQSVVERPLAPGVEEKSAALLGCEVNLSFDRPFLVDAEPRSGNVLFGSEVIPGSIIKAAIADMLELAGVKEEYDDLLSLLTVRHAFPGSKRLPVLPLSYAVDGDRLIDVLVEESKNPRFQMDWKDADWKLEGLGKHYLGDRAERYVRTRTAVGRTNVAMDKQLFSYSMIATRKANGEELLWNSRLHLPDGIEDRFTHQLGELCDFLAREGILRVGKTAAGATIRIGSRFKPGHNPSWSEKVRLTLRSPAWMIPTSALLSDDGLAKVTGDAWPMYRKYFDDLGCELVDFVALQNWSGGARAIGRRSAHDEQYYPWLLTRPGSVFILSGADSRELNDWARYGLPLPDPERDWTNCPFVRESGFGEIEISDVR